MGWHLCRQSLPNVACACEPTTPSGSPRTLSRRGQTYSPATCWYGFATTCRPGTKWRCADVPAGGQVRKYGQVIGVATRAIAAGEHVHTHNLAFADFERDYAFGVDLPGARTAPSGAASDLQGHRQAGRAGGDQELHRHPDLGQLLGDRGPDGGRPVRRKARTSWPRTPTSTASWL